ncbi:hypothetical protein [Thalassobellus citreus]|uniref:hypothetical protein n=1 Tax=Thalassobellus citreus TaxID=3367752 RepID=UPI0037A78E6D
MFKKHIFILFLLIVSVSFSQKKDTLYVNNQLKKAETLQQTDFLKAKELLADALKISNDIKYDFGVLQSNIILGQIAYYHGEHNVSIKYYQKAIDFIQNNKLSYPDKTGYCYSKMGASYYYLADYKKSVEVALQSLEYFTGKDQNIIIGAYRSLGVVY